MTRIAVLDDWQKIARDMADWSPVEKDAEIVVFHDHLDDPDALVARLEHFDVVCVMRERTPLPADVLERLPRLRLIVTTGRGNASIDVAAATQRGITVCGTEGFGTSTAELAMALILMLARNLHTETRSVKDGGWQVGIGRDLAVSTLGLIGLGRLGGEVAKRAAAFGMTLLAWSPNLTEARATACGARLVDKDTLLRRSDFVTIHLKLSARSAGLIGARELGLMKPDAYLVNTSRGPIVDEAALIAALREKRIAGAGLDVFDQEPLPADHPLRRLDSVVLTPHVGYVTDATYRIFYPETVDLIRAWLDGRPRNIVPAS